MDLRKVQLTGGSSITVTLPKAWVDKAQLQAGDVVGCAEQPDGSLAIHPHAKGARGASRYDIEVEEGDEGYLFRKLIAAYLMGFDAIRVKSRRPLTAGARLTVRQAVRRIMGLEIVEEEAKSMTVQDFLDPKEFHIDKALRRMGMLARAMQQEAVACLKSPSADLAKSVRERDDEVDRLYWLVNKQYHAMLRDVSYASKMGITASQALNFLLVARLVERTADHADRITQQAVLLPRGKATDTLVERLEKNGHKAVEMFQGALQTFITCDARKADALIDESKRFAELQERLLKEAASLGGDAVAHIAFIIESITRTAAYAADIAEVTINHKVATPAEA